MKRPAFQFYPADWRNDAALRMCSIAARGLWWEMICIMHMAEPYGYLVAAGRPIDPTGLARVVGESRSDVTRWLAELRAHKVFSTDHTGAIYSRRMIRDEKARDEWRKRQARHRDVTQPVTPMSPRSSDLHSSSSSSEAVQEPGAVAPKPRPKNGVHNLGTRLPDDWRLPEEWKAWALEIRPDWTPQGVVRESISFRDYWIASSGSKAVKRNWLATWRIWIRRAKAEPTL